MGDGVSWQKLVGISNDEEDGSVSPIFHKNKWIVYRKPVKSVSSQHDNNRGSPVEGSSRSHNQSKKCETGDANKSQLEIANEDIITFSPIRTRRSSKRKSSESESTPKNPKLKRSKLNLSLESVLNRSFKEANRQVSDVPNTLAHSSHPVSTTENEGKKTSTDKPLGDLYKIKRKLLYSTNKLPVSSSVSHKLSISDFYKSIFMIEEADKSLSSINTRSREFPKSSEEFVAVSSLTSNQLSSSKPKSRVLKTAGKSTSMEETELKSHTASPLLRAKLLNDSLNDFQFTEVENNYCHSQPKCHNNKIYDCEKTPSLDMTHETGLMESPNTSGEMTILTQLHTNKLNRNLLSLKGRQSSVTKQCSKDNVPNLNVNDSVGKCKKESKNSPLFDLKEGVDTANPLNIPRNEQLKDNLSSVELKFKDGLEDSVRFDEILTPEDMFNPKAESTECKDVNLPNKTPLLLSKNVVRKKMKKNLKLLLTPKTVNSVEGGKQNNADNPQHLSCSKSLPSDENAYIENNVSVDDFSKHITKPLENNHLYQNSDQNSSTVLPKVDSLVNTECDVPSDLNESIVSKERCTYTDSDDGILGIGENKTKIENLLENVLDKPTSDVPLQRYLSEDFNEIKHTVVQFSTAGGSVVKTSQESLDKAMAIMKEVFEGDLPSEINKDSTLNSVAAKFKSAKGSQITFSSNSLAKALALFGDVLGDQEKDSKPSDDEINSKSDASSCFPKDSGGEQLKNNEINTQEMHYSVEQNSKTSKSSGHIFINNQPSTSSNQGPDMDNISGKCKLSKHQSQETNFVMPLKTKGPSERSCKLVNKNVIFTTAKGLTLTISDKSLVKANALLKDILEEDCDPGVNSSPKQTTVGNFCLISSKDKDQCKEQGGISDLKNYDPTSKLISKSHNDDLFISVPIKKENQNNKELLKNQSDLLLEKMERDSKSWKETNRPEESSGSSFDEQLEQGPHKHGSSVEQNNGSSLNKPISFQFSSASGGCVSVKEEAVRSVKSILHKAAPPDNLFEISNEESFNFSQTNGKTILLSKEKDLCTKLRHNDQLASPSNVSTSPEVKSPQTDHNNSLLALNSSVFDSLQFSTECFFNNDKTANEMPEHVNVNNSLPVSTNSSSSLTNVIDKSTLKKSAEKLELEPTKGNENNVNFSKFKVKIAKDSFQDEVADETNHLDKNLKNTAESNSKKGQLEFKKELDQENEETKNSSIEPSQSRGINDQGVIFSTAKGRSVNISKESWKKVLDQFKNEIEEESSIHTFVDPNQVKIARDQHLISSTTKESDVNVSEERYKKELESTDQNKNASNQNLIVSSAKGSSTDVSKESLNKVCLQLKSELEEENKGTKKLHSGLQQTQGILKQNFFFSTAKGSSVNVSEESLRKICLQFNSELDEENEEIKKVPSEHCQIQPVNDQFCIFSTAKGSSVNVSDESLKKVHLQFKSELEEENKEIKIVLPEPCQILPVNAEITMFSTAKGSSVNVSEESLKKVCLQFESELEEENKETKKLHSELQQTEVVDNQSFIFSTAKGSSVNVSEESLKKVRLQFKSELEEENERTKKLYTEPCRAEGINEQSFTFSTAKGSSVNVSDESLKKVRQQFRKELTEENEETEKLSSEPRQVHPANNNIFMFSTAKGNLVNVSEESLKKVHLQFQSELEEENVAIKLPSKTLQSEHVNELNFTFPTAKGSSVNVSGESLKKIQQQFRKELEEETEEAKILPSGQRQVHPVNNQIFMFSTAKGSSVNVSDESLKKVCLQFNSELEEENKEIKKLSLEPCQADCINEQSFTFSTAKDSSVNVSEESLRKVSLQFQSELEEESENTKKLITRAPQIQDVNDQSFIFSTAKGSSVNESEESLRKVSLQFQSELEEESENTKKLITRAPQIQDVNDQSFIFSTAKGSSVTVSDESLKLVRLQFRNELEEENEETKKLLIENHQVQGVNDQGFMFSTAKGSSIKVSEESLKKVCLQFKSELEEEIEEPKIQPLDKILSNVNSEFFTSEGKALNVSEDIFKERKLSKDKTQVKISNEISGKVKNQCFDEDLFCTQTSFQEENILFKTPTSLKSSVLNKRHLTTVPRDLCKDVEFSNNGFCSTNQLKDPLLSTSKDIQEELALCSEKVFIGDKNVQFNKESFKVPSHNMFNCPSRKPNESDNCHQSTSHRNQDDTTSSDPSAYFTQSLKGHILDEELGRIETLVHGSHSGKHSILNASISAVASNKSFANDGGIEQPHVSSEEKPFITSPSTVFNRSMLQPINSWKYVFDNDDDDDILAAAETPKKQNEVFDASIEKQVITSPNDKRKSIADSPSRPSCKRIKIDDKMLVVTDELITIRHARRAEQQSQINCKLEKGPSPSAGLYMSIRKEQALLRFMDSSLNKLQAFSRQQLLDRGVLEEVIDVTSRNASGFQFIASHYYEPNECYSKNGIIDVGYDFTLILSDDNKIGLEEFSRCFLSSPHVAPSLVPQGWIKNHYRWIVWKLACLEKSFPQHTKRFLTPLNVLHQLKYRYDREIDLVQRPAFRRILECDEPAGRRFVACVADIRKIDSDELDPAIELELTDGWYSLWSTIDEEMIDLVKKGKVNIGTKLIIHGSELLNCGDGCDPLELRESIRLKLNSNSTRRVKWFTRMGFTQHPGPIGISLDSVLPNGGTIGLTTAVIARVYPMLYMSKDSNDKTVIRNFLAENQIATAFEKEHNAKSEELYEKILAEVEAKYKKCIPIKFDLKNIKQIINPEVLWKVVSKEPEIHSMLTPEQQLKVQNYHEQVSVKIREEVKTKLEEELKESMPVRKVTNLLKLRLVDPLTESDAMLTIWRPTEDLCRLLVENRCFDFYSINACGRRDRVVQLANTKNTRYKGSSLFTQRSKFARQVTDISALTLEKGFPLFGELDTVGVVIHVKEPDKPWGVTNVYLSNLDNHFLMITFWTSLKAFGCEELLTECSVVAVTNLHWRQGSGSYVVPSTFANETTYFSTNPSQEYLSKELSHIKKTILPEGMKSFVETRREVLLSLLKERTPNVTPIRRPVHDSGVTKKLEWLKRYGPASPIPKFPLLLSPDVRKGFKSPKLNKSSSRSPQV